VFWVGLVALPARLIYANLPQMRTYNSLELKKFGEAAAQLLPPKGAVVVSDDFLRLTAVYAAACRAGIGQNYLFLDAGAMPHPFYQAHLRRKYGPRWPELPKGPARQVVDSLSLVQLLMEAAKEAPVYYLHPSFGYYFEKFYSVPHGLVQELRAYPSNTVEAPLLTPGQIKENDEYWKRLDDENLKRLVQTVKQSSESKRLTQASSVPLLVGAFYARALNYWGVELQRSGQLESAGKYFAHALDFNPENPCAFVNLEFNRHLRAGGKGGINPSDDAMKKLAPYRGSWEAIVNVNGPMDEPNNRYLFSESLVNGGNFRQAAQQLLRTLEFSPREFDFEIALASYYIPAGFPDKSLQLITQIRTRPGASGLTLTNQLRLVQVEAMAFQAKNDFATAERLLRDAQDKHPGESLPFEALNYLYYSRAEDFRRQNNETAYKGELTNMLANLEKQLEIQTNNFNALSFYGALKAQLKEYDTAILNLNRALNLRPENLPVRLNRAIANWQSDRLDEAEKDYLTLEGMLPKPLYSIYYGLADIAYRKNQKKNALMYYKKYLQYAPPGAPEIKYVIEKINALKKAGAS
jgi:tetratricopeptide (TPR) repeat protein